MTWIGLEINLLIFVPLIIKKDRKYQAEARLKYFLTQASASVFILIRLRVIKNQSLIARLILSLALLLKIGAAPAHQWIITVSTGLTWQAVFIIFVPQKIGPMLLISITLPAININILIFFIMTRAIIGSIGGLTPSSLKKIIAYSSVSHLSWLLTSMLLKKHLWACYFVIYSIILWVIIISFHIINYKNISDIFFREKTTIKTLLIINILSLAGLPPFRGFLIKIIVLEGILQSSLILLIPFLLTGTLIRLFFYIRIITPNLFLTTTKINIKQNLNNNSLLLIINIFGLLISLPLIIFLDFKLY